jgi:predicted secreted protein
MISVDRTFNRRVVSAMVGDLLRLELPENATAGSRWRLPHPLPDQLLLVMDKTSRDPASYSDGERRLDFRIVASGKFSLCLLNPQTFQKASSSFEIWIDAQEADSELHVGPTSDPPFQT